MLEPHLNQVEYEATQRKYYGRIVMTAILQLGTAITKNDLVRYVANLFGQPIEIVKEGVIRSLELGVQLGFFVKNGNLYSLSTHTGRTNQIQN